MKWYEAGFVSIFHFSCGMFRMFDITVSTDDFQQERKSSAGMFSCSIQKRSGQPEEEQAKEKGEQANIQEA